MSAIISFQSSLEKVRFIDFTAGESRTLDDDLFLPGGSGVNECLSDTYRLASLRSIGAGLALFFFRIDFIGCVLTFFYLPDFSGECEMQQPIITFLKRIKNYNSTLQFLIIFMFKLNIWISYFSCQAL